MKPLNITRRIFLMMNIFLPLSLFCVGFSAWSIGKKPEISGQFSAENQANIMDLKGSAFTILNSEEGFSFYKNGTDQIYSKTCFSFKIKVRPDLLSTFFSGNDLNVIVGIQYQLFNGEQIDIFAADNPYFIPPKMAVFKIDNSANRAMYSNNLIYERSEEESRYSLTGDLLLYSDTQPSIYSIAKDYQKKQEFINISIIFEFEHIGDIPDAFQYINFDFLSSVPEGA